MYTRQQLSLLIGQYISELSMPTQPQKLYEPIAYSLEDGGKRLRPLILLLCCNLFCDRTKVIKALPAAAAIEVFHNFTLLHDDIMDNAPVRRGKAAVHKKWDTNTAILSGDAMMIYAYTLLSKVDTHMLGPVMEEFNKMAIEVCEGQQYDMDFETYPEVTLEQYIEMIRLKTSVLLAGSAKIGAILGGASTTQSQVIYNFAISLGLAFQIQDDFLDTYGNDSSLGKSIGGDIAEGKKTFLTITALKSAPETTRQELTALLKDKNLDKKIKFNKIKTIYDSLNIADKALSAIEGYICCAIDSLNSLGVEKTRREPLKELTTSLLNRNK